MIAEELQVMLTNAADMYRRIRKCYENRMSAEEREGIDQMESDLRQCAATLEKAAIILHPSQLPNS